MKEVINTLKKWEKVAYENEDDFINRFCRGSHVMTLNGVYFSSENMKITYITDEGIHITDRFKIEEWEKFYNEKLHNT